MAFLLLLIVLGGLLINELVLTKRVTNLEQLPKVTQVVVATPTVEPTATPTATLKFVPRVTLAPTTKVK